MVEHLLPKQEIRVRFSYPASNKFQRWEGKSKRHEFDLSVRIRQPFGLRPQDRRLAEKEDSRISHNSMLCKMGKAFADLRRKS